MVSTKIPGFNSELRGTFLYTLMDFDPFTIENTGGILSIPRDGDRFNLGYFISRHSSGLESSAAIISGDFPLGEAGRGKLSVNQRDIHGDLFYRISFGINKRF